MKNRLRIISLLPIFLLFVISALSTYFFVLEFKNYSSFQKSLDKSEVLNQALIELGKERVLTILFLNKKISYEELQKQYIQTDQRLNLVKKYFQSAYPKEVAALSIIKIARQKSKEGSDTLKNIIYGLYTNAATGSILKIEQKMASPIKKREIVEKYALIYSLSNSIDASSVESGYVVNFLVNKKPLGIEAKKLWISYMSKSDNFMNEPVLNPYIEGLVQKYRFNKEIMEIYNRLRTLRVQIVEAKGVDYKEWIEVNDKKIDSFYRSLKDLVKIVRSDVKNQIRFTTTALAISLLLLLLSIVLMVVSYLFIKDITWNIKKLENLFKKVALSEDISKEDKNLVNKINLDTIEGINRAYEVLEKALKRTEDAKEAAQEANKTKSIFLANMSHEIRTPLNGIMGFTDLLKHTNLTEEQKEFVNIIEKSSENLLEIINNILDIAKIENNKVELESVVFEPIAEFENAVEVYAPKAAEKGIDFALFIDPNLEKPLKGDPTKIKEVLINLISNAVKFTPKGGEIVVEIRKREKINSKVVIDFSVEDTGIGIPQEKKEKIFEAFSQADASVTRRYGGTGLGLTISREFIKLMGGELKIDSQEGKGSRFYFTLELEEIPILNESYKDRFQGIKVSFFESKEKRKRQNGFIKEYFDYFGVRTDFYNDINRMLQNAKESSFVLLDFDYVKEPQIKSFYMNKIPVALISKVTYKKRIEELMGKIMKYVYEPANYSKLKNLLEFYIQNSKTIEQKTHILASSDNIRFKARALVVEDNIINQKLIKKTLEDLGLEVDLADNGLEAIEKFKQNRYDIIFMDIQMPIKDGIEAMQEIHLYEKEMHLIPTPIIALTAHALKGDRERFMKKGFDEYITKPINRSDIVTILKAFLPDKIYYPSADEVEQRVQSEKRKEEPRRYDYDILLLKKSALENKLFANVLKSLGYSVDVAADLEDMMQKLLKRRYKILFIDRDSDFYNFHQIKTLKNVYPDTKFVLLVEPEFDISSLPAMEREYYDDIIRNIIKKDFFKKEIEKLLQEKEEV